MVSKHVGPSTVLIRHATRNAEKIVNVELVKPDRSPHEDNIAEHPTPDTAEENAGDEEYTLEFSVQCNQVRLHATSCVTGHNFRRRLD